MSSNIKETNANNELLNNNNEFFERLNLSIVTETNRLRADPSSYIPILETYKNKFKGNVLKKENSSSIETYEGVSAFDNAIEFLYNQKPVNTLTYDDRLTIAAQDHVNDIGPLGLFSHESSSTLLYPSERVDKYCEWEICCCENIDLACSSGIECIVNLLVDDGDISRTRRKNLFNVNFNFFGVASGKHKNFETIVVINYVGGIRDKDKPFFNKSNYKYEYPKDLGLNNNLNTDVNNKKYKTAYQLQDNDAPDGTKDVKIRKHIRLYEGKSNRVTKKYYNLDNGNQHIVEIEEF